MPIIDDNPKRFFNSNFYNRILTDSNILRHIHPLISCVSPTDIPVMIFGETGTWKPLFARLIHNNSLRKNNKFITIDINEFLGQDNENSELNRIEKIEQANGGSILLNEIDKMPSKFQYHLLQIIQNREFHCINRNKVIPIDVRIIATASNNIESNVKNGKFRKDLYYRIAVFPISIPPLRESIHDIEIFAKRILDIASKRQKKVIKGISDDAMKLLNEYDWPRNFDELEEVIKNAVKLENSEKLQVLSLPKKILKKELYSSSICHISTDSILSLAEIEKQALINAMRITGNNVQLVADALGINRATVYRKLEKYSLF
ncbi:TPA: sigma-54-dependent Fis family transcriptional regulator [bacterium]|nr:sigma-54-dependent Fis family transcriptional regulator [bacterium]